MSRKALFGVAIAILAVVFIVGTLTYTGQKTQDGAAPSAPAASRDALVRPNSPSIGDAGAPVVIVEFLDPACETCADFYPRVKQMVTDHPGSIRVVLRWAPFHTGSEQVVAALEGAKAQGKMYEALEALLASQGDWAADHSPRVELIWKHLEGLGLNLDKVRADMATPAVQQVIAQDLADARTLNVTQTPEYFVNGKPLPTWGWDQLQQLVNDELRAAGRR